MEDVSNDNIADNPHIAAIRSKVKKGKRIVFVSGKFNIIHPGHLRFLNFAASCGDYLVVGLLPDDASNTLIAADLRQEGVQAIGIVDHAFVLDMPPAEFIRILRPAVVVKGREYAHRDNVEEAIMDEYGGKLVFSSGEIRFSSMDLLRSELHDVNMSNIRMPADYPARHGFKMADLIDLVRQFAKLNVVVIGDLIVDEYINCEPLGMSREDPTLVVSPFLTERFVGGAGIVAAHARGIGAQVSYFAVTGDDVTSQYAKETLSGYGVECSFLTDDTRPTTLKQRYRAGNKTLLRVSHLRQHDINDHLIDEMVDAIRPALAKADLVIFSDFNYGCLPTILVDRIAEICNQRNTPMVADSQASSQIGDVSRFQNMQLLTPTEHEARLAVRDFQSGIIVLAEALRAKAQSKHVILTLASEGVIVLGDHPQQGLITDRLPAFNNAPKDVSGAGDCLLTCASMALTMGAGIWKAAYLGSVAAACQVSRVGNTPLTANELISELSS